MENFQNHKSEKSAGIEASQNLLADSGAYDQSCKLPTWEKATNIGVNMAHQAMLEGVFWQRTTGNPYAVAAGIGLGLAHGYKLGEAQNSKQELDCIESKKSQVTNR